MAEFDLIARIARRARSADGDVALGIGDDAALLRLGTGETLVAAVDTLVAGRHFPRATAPADIGWKALAVNLSDLAAMGAQPRFALLALTLPRADAVFVDALLDGFMHLARRHRVRLVGGDTTRGPLSLTVTALGALPGASVTRRDGAKVGDAIFVSGTLGDAAGALRLRRQWSQPVDPRALAFIRARLDRPQPRVALGMALREIASAAIDISDGLLADLGHVLRASRVGALIEAAALPLSPALKRAVADPKQCLQLALSGGDDYELCLTVPAARESELRAAAKSSGSALARIGEITRGRDLRVLDASGRVLAAPRTGYQHFANSRS